METSEILELAENLENFTVDAAYGRAMLSAHRLERILVLLIACHNVDPNNKKAVSAYKEEIARLDTLPFGRIKNEVERVLNLSEYWVEELDNMRWFRNELAHRAFSITNRYGVYEGDLEKTIENLDQIRSYFQETMDHFEPILFEKAKSFGVTKELVTAEVLRRKRNANEKNVA